MKLVFVACLSPLLTLTSCSAETPAESAERVPHLVPISESLDDVRVEVPDLDPAYVDFVSPELTIPAGTEKIYCVHLRYEGEDTAFDEARVFQGRFGHHATLFTARVPKAPGTVEDCTSVDTAKDYDHFGIGAKVPPGYATSLRQGQPLVLQMHYINTTRMPLLVRDLVRVHQVPLASVHTWTSSLVLSAVDLVSIPPRTRATVSFDCAVPVDGDVLLWGAHLHEYGSSVFLDRVASDGALEPLYELAKWKPEYRDAPPLTDLAAAPLHLGAGETLRVTCTWENPTDALVRWPEEMCSVFASYAGVRDAIECIDGTVASL